MLTVTGLEKSYGGQTLFAGAALQVNRGDRIGLVGPNGAGKSTLFKLILGEELPDRGSVVLPRGVQVGYLPQESAPAAEETVLELALAGEVGVLWRRGVGDEEREGWDHEQHEAHRRFEEVDGHRTVARALQILKGLGFREADAARPACTLSGGWVMRAHLARLLVQAPELLLLDEPTNHLDLEALLWFQDHLVSYPGGILVISHDREFLNRLADSIVEIRQGRLVRFRGDYEAYLEQREALVEQQSAAYKNQQREIARLQRFVDRFRAKNTKASQAQSKLKLIERMDKVEAPEGEAATIDFAFPQPDRSGRRVVTLRGIQHAYGDNVVYRGLDFEVERGQRIVLVGPNGSGKSTLLKLLAGVIEPQQGTRALGHRVRTGYFSQYRLEVMDADHTVLEEALNSPRAVGELFARTVLGCFLFRGDDVFKPVRVLSGGEKSRLALVKLLLDPPNLLLLDEPTTHLDIPSTEALLAALQDYTGTIVLISHDVFFIRNIADRVIHVRDGRLTIYPGGYDYYVEKTAASGPAELADRSPRPSTATVPEGLAPAQLRREKRRVEAEQRQAQARARREARQQVDRLEAEIHTLEQRQTELTRQLADPATYETAGTAAELRREFHDLRGRLEQLTPEWEAAATRLVEIEATSIDASQPG
jgi:ATP-binding cassette, subfamily F, member 3